MPIIEDCDKLGKHAKAIEALAPSVQNNSVDYFVSFPPTKRQQQKECYQTKPNLISLDPFVKSSLLSQKLTTIRSYKLAINTSSQISDDTINGSLCA